MTAPQRSRTRSPVPMLSRRSFLGTSLAGLAAGPLFADDKPAKTDSANDLPPLAKTVEFRTFEPTTLFLTWQRDPTTTMTVQWVGTVGETADTKVYYTVNPFGQWLVQATATRPYPMTDFKVFRAELTGLHPGTDY